MSARMVNAIGDAGRMERCPASDAVTIEAAPVGGERNGSE